MNEPEEKKLISERAADLLIGLRDGDAALVYLYLCRRGMTDRDQAARDLYLPKQRLSEAFERLEMLGLLPLAEEAPVKPVSAAEPSDVSASPLPGGKYELPDYTAAEVRSRQESDSAFSALIAEAQLIMGRPLSTPDLIKLLGIYDHLDLPPEVMMELMNFVADLYRWKYGERRRPSARAFELEARKWVEHGITDFEAAELYIRKVRDRRSQEGAIKAAMKVEDRDFTDTERRYVEQWLDWGFGAEVIAFAYDKTVTKTRKFSPAYMNKILMNWHEKALFTIQDIQEKDRPIGKRSSSAPESAAHPAGDPGNVWDTVNMI
ncbi:MAG: DnaD domain protein [Oscillospiraceae bacterium]|nr:DnaD domain protein [Oscillospiraceae bacterium]